MTAVLNLRCTAIRESEYGQCGYGRVCVRFSGARSSALGRGRISARRERLGVAWIVGLWRYVRAASVARAPHVASRSRITDSMYAAWPGSLTCRRTTAGSLASRPIRQSSRSIDMRTRSDPPSPARGEKGGGEGGGWVEPSRTSGGLDVWLTVHTHAHTHTHTHLELPTELLGVGHVIPKEPVCHGSTGRLISAAWDRVGRWASVRKRAEVRTCSRHRSSTCGH